MDFICPSHLSGGAPVLFTHKKDRALHLWIDFHGLNKIMKDCYPLPHISNLLNSQHKVQIFSKFDLWHAYHLVCIQEGDGWKTTFCMCYRSFEWCIMHFRLTNSLATFQHFMNNIFGNILNVCMLMHLDDICPWNTLMTPTASSVCTCRQALLPCHYSSTLILSSSCTLH